MRSSEADVAYGHEQRGAGLVGIPQIVRAVWRHAAGNIEPASAELSASQAVGRKDFLALLQRFDLAQLARRDVGIKDIKAFVVGSEQRGVAAGPCRWECAAAAATIGRRQRRRGQIPEGESGESCARADQQRFLEFAQGDRRVCGLVSEGPLGHLEAQTEPPRAPAIEGLEQRVGPSQVQQFRLSRHFDSPKPAMCAKQAQM